MNPRPVSAVLIISTGSPSDTQSSQFDVDSLSYAKCNRPTHDVAIHERQLASVTAAISTVSDDVRGVGNSIASQETITQLWYCVSAQRELDMAQGGNTPSRSQSSWTTA